MIGRVVSLALMTTMEFATFARAGLLLLVGVAAWAVNWVAHARHAPALSPAAPATSAS